MKDTGERYECKCGQIFSGPTSKLEFLKHQTECSCREECDDKVVITPIAHYDNIAVTYSCSVTVYHDGFKVVSFEIYPDGCNISNPDIVVASVKRTINMVQEAKVVVKQLEVKQIKPKFKKGETVLLKKRRKRVTITHIDIIECNGSVEYTFVLEGEDCPWDDIQTLGGRYANWTPEEEFESIESNH